MHNINSVKYAIPSLLFSLLMGLTTLVHHLHAALLVESGGAGMHIVWNEIVIIPLTALLMVWIIRDRNRFALWLYLGIAVLGFIGLGLYEGGWNHTLRLLAYLRIDSPSTQISTLLPSDNLHLWFYEFTGVLTLVCTLAASYFTYRFAREINISK